MSLTIQFYTMAAMIGVGSWLGAAIDTYGRFLQREKRAKWFIFINDVLFWLLQGLITFYVLLLVNEGELRFYILIALLCGYAAYQALLRNIFLRLLETLIQWTINLYLVLEKIFRLIIVRPIQAVVQAIIVLIIAIGKGLYNIGKMLVIILWKVTLVLLWPLKAVGLLLWKLTPNFVKKYLEIFIRKLAGFYEIIKNTTVKVIKYLKNFRKVR
ncbi:spore cortex biosynthesis protein YabQ [Sutcliffiella sp. NC1]|uniref:spore cortex biosynthesis protein YabQ n=1 Tax=Sutcliffiella sp. NC1 TaxID=3004096 RepID=UPI0022DE7932|nr:spore cortex biosynthesis protein YabQ [Sutcliffiella sp. NC1]WBL15194.1 spore cortex biosynthesis protein YabQ [Sutcliffiella sp. NC1]